MKKICLFVNLLLIISLAAHSQYLSDSLTIKKINYDSLKYSVLHILPVNYYACNLGFFCKKELQLQKAVKIPVYLRLGDLEYCNKLEGKK